MYCTRVSSVSHILGIQCEDPMPGNGNSSCDPDNVLAIICNFTCNTGLMCQDVNLIANATICTRSKFLNINDTYIRIIISFLLKIYVHTTEKPNTLFINLCNTSTPHIKG